MKINRQVNISRISLLIMTILILWAVLTVLLFPSIKNNQCQLVYSLDDTYIHMAIAKNFASHGVWGVTRYQFTSSSSSILWTLLVALSFTLFGVKEIIPLIMNGVIASILLVFLFYWLEKNAYRFYQMALILLVFIFFIPLHYLIFIGLEHTLQIFLDLLFAGLAARIISGDSSEKNLKHGLALAGLALLVVLVRFEGLFLVFSVSVLLLVSKRILNSVLCLVSGFLPVLVYGLISVSKGWFFLPNSVLLKGSRPDISTVSGWLDFFYQGIRQFVYNVHIFILVLTVLVLLSFWVRKFSNLKSKAPTVGVIFIITTVLHLFFARSGYYLNYYFQIRYDAYLLGLGLFAVFALIAPFKKEKSIRDFIPGMIKILLVVILMLPLAERGIRTVVKINPAARNTFTYQYQMARFLQQFYQGKKIVLNDIGAPNYFADIKCLDIMALASKEVGDLILTDQYSSQSIFKLARDYGASIAIINDVLLKDVGGVPAPWIRVGQWKITNSVISNLNVLSFYALSAAEVPRLHQCLSEFSARLPEEVEQRILLRISPE